MYDMHAKKDINNVLLPCPVFDENRRAVYQKLYFLDIDINSNVASGELG